MTEWPKNPQLHVGGTLEPDGPVNVFNEKLAVADAINRATETKTAYDTTHTTPPPEQPPPPDPIGPPISAGGPVILADQSRYMIDASASGGRRRR
jgi:hypothetical protein